MNAVDVHTFIRDRREYLPSNRDDEAIEFAAPRVHYESQDTWSGTVSCCLDWRAEIRLSALDASGRAPDVVAGFVDFLVLQLGNQPVAEALELYGVHAEAFAELFEDAWMASDIDEADDFAAGMPISAVLLVLHAEVDPAFAHYGQLRPWAVSQVVNTMLPTTAGVVAMNAFPSPSPRADARHLVDAEHLDPDWPRVGCMSIPGHPTFFGRATAYTFLDDARAALDAVREQTFRVSVS